MTTNNTSTTTKTSGDKGLSQVTSDEKRSWLMVAPDKKTLKKSVKSMFFMVQTRYEVETIKY